MSRMLNYLSLPIKMVIDKVFTTLVLSVFMGALLLFGLLSCNNYRAPDPIVTHFLPINNPGRDTVMVLENRNRTSSFSISYQGTLSDMAIIRFSTNNSFSQNGGFAIPVHQSIKQIVRDMAGDSLFIQYQPIKDTTSGDLAIGITFHK